MLKFLLAFVTSSTITHQLMTYEKKMKQDNKNKQHVVLLGDGFLARGFLDTIDKSKFRITQVYNNTFINPQDMIYQLNKDKWNTDPLHIRDIIRKKPDNTIQVKINDMRYFENTCIINENTHEYSEISLNYDHLVIGLGSQITLNDWQQTIKNLININNKNIGIIGMGPTGIELATILSRNNNITIIDTLSKVNTLNYLSQSNKDAVFSILSDNNIKTIFNQFYNPYNHHFDTTVMCVGNRVNRLVSGVKVDEKCRDISNNNVYLGGDCANTNLPKTAQVAYAQGIYIAKQINGIENRPFRYIDRLSKDLSKDQDNKYYNYISQGMSLNIGNNQNIICGHKYLPDGKYPCEILKLYSMFIV
jgi:NADH dehydrogenase FAD-containing subunit